ncbi:CBS domain-containing protein [Jatrophihabitans endophyticus]|uniref:CBS domain-containing protein n=1 Tax=Jatrophihabitans endophyticus TaxID=1206085 RepID=A0A1M5UG74_9ACTN|nr:CBS domain-containing protein [Jatrophihabitans endophyticus]SHH61941.1 CBS domain-containing protein [Jatrophihabitans endophyticus]
MNISDLLQHKQSGDQGQRPAVVTIAPTDTVTALLRALAEHNVGALLVTDDAGGADIAGIVSERDVVRRVAERGAEVLDTAVGDIMTTTVVSCTGHDDVHSVAETMTRRRIRHMPVVDDGRLTGIVSIGDVVAARMAQLEQDREQLEHYISS